MRGQARLDRCASRTPKVRQHHHLLNTTQCGCGTSVTHGSRINSSSNKFEHGDSTSSSSMAAAATATVGSSTAAASVATAMAGSSMAAAAASAAMAMAGSSTVAASAASAATAQQQQQQQHQYHFNLPHLCNLQRGSNDCCNSSSINTTFILF